MQIFKAAEARLTNPVLRFGQIVTELETGLRKKGDGATRWNALPYDLSTGPRLGRRWGVLGDSISAQAVVASGGVTGWAANSYVSWMRRYLNASIDLSNDRVYAVSSATVGQPAGTGQPFSNTVLDGQVPQAIAAGLDVAVVHMGTNSVADLMPTATLIAQFRQVYEALWAAGIFVIAIPIRVRGASAQWNTAYKLQQWAQVNRWIRDLAMQNGSRMLCIDPNPVLMDFGTGNARAGFFLDDLHDNAISAQVMGQLIANTVAPLLPAMDSSFMIGADVYDPVSNPTGNLLPYGLFAGTAGNATIGGATGSCAWDLGRNNGGSTTSVAGSKAVDANLANLPVQVVTFGGTADGNVNFMASYLPDVSVVSPGDRIVFEVQCEGAMTTATLGGITAFLQCQDASYGGLAGSYDGLYNNGLGGLPAGIGSFVMRTEPIVVPLGTHYVSANVYMQQMTGGGAIAGALKFRRASIRKVLS